MNGVPFSQVSNIEHTLGGALRWRAPEILDGLGFVRPTDSADVYAFAVFCVESLGRGALPWSRLDDEDVRALVLGKSSFKIIYLANHS